MGCRASWKSCYKWPSSGMLVWWRRKQGAARVARGVSSEISSGGGANPHEHACGRTQPPARAPTHVPGAREPTDVNTEYEYYTY